MRFSVVSNESRSCNHRNIYGTANSCAFRREFYRGLNEIPGKRCRFVKRQFIQSSELLELIITIHGLRPRMRFIGWLICIQHSISDFGMPDYIKPKLWSPFMPTIRRIPELRRVSGSRPPRAFQNGTCRFQSESRLRWFPL